MTITRFSPCGLHGTFVIGEDEVHVWRAGLDTCRAERPSVSATLAADERAGRVRGFLVDGAVGSRVHAGADAP
jgi:hypothetical protein